MPPPSSPSDNFTSHPAASEQEAPGSPPATAAAPIATILPPLLPPPLSFSLFQPYPQMLSDPNGATISSLHRMNLLLRYYLRNRVLLDTPASSQPTPSPTIRDHLSSLRQTRLIMDFNRNNNLFLDFQRRSRHRRLRQHRQRQRQRLQAELTDYTGSFVYENGNQDDTDFCEDETNDDDNANNNENSDASASYEQGDDENESDNSSTSSDSVSSVDSLNNLDSIVSPGFMSIDEDLDNDYSNTHDISSDVPMSSTSSSSLSDENIDDQLQNSFPITLQSLRSDINTNERLLLSSARQNPSNRNTLVPNHPLPHPMEAIPLRRQNAIRMRNRYSHQSLETDPLLLCSRKDEYEHSLRSTNLLHYLTTQEIQNLRNDHLNSIFKLIKSLEHLKNFPGRSPIFGNHSSRHNLNNATIASLLHLNNSSVLSLNDQLDSFLYQRKSKLLWNEEWNKNILRKTIPPPPLTSAKKRKYDRQQRLLDSYHQISSKVKAKWKKEAKSQKRALPNDEMVEESSHKRRKPGITSDVKPKPSQGKPKPSAKSHAKCNHFYNEGERIDSSRLSPEQKHNIMNILPSSYLQSGSSFQVMLEQQHDSKRQRDTGFMDINMNNVDYKLRNIFGSFSLFDKISDPQMLGKFISFFAGFKDSKNIPRDKSIYYKLQLLTFLNQDLATYREKKGPEHLDTRKTTKFSFPFKGSLIDFKNNDLRFFSSPYKERGLSHYHLSSSPSSSHYHESKVKSQEVRFQLFQWFNVEPFNQCTVMFFFNHLLCIARFLKNFGRLSIKVKEQNFAFFDDLRSNINYITNQFHFLKYLKPSENPIRKFTENNIPSVINSGSDSRFVIDWEKRLSDKFADFLTCNDHCLLNVQLNFILFTIKFNLSELLTEFLNYKLSLLPPPLFKKYNEILKTFTKKDDIKNNSKFNCTLLCSLNRKTGSVQIFNPLSAVTYSNKYHHYLDSSSNFSFESRNRLLRRSNAMLAAELAAGYGEDYTMMLGAFDDIDHFDNESDDGYVSPNSGNHDNDSDNEDEGELTDESFLKLFKSDETTEYTLLEPIYVNPAADNDIPQLVFGQTRRHDVNQLSYGGGNGTFSYA